MRLLLIVGSSLAALALFLLATATADTTLFAQQYPFLLVFNAQLGALLAAVVAYHMLDFVRGYRATSRWTQRWREASTSASRQSTR